MPHLTPSLSVILKLPPPPLSLSTPTRCSCATLSELLAKTIPSQRTRSSGCLGRWASASVSAFGSTGVCYRKAGLALDLVEAHDTVKAVVLGHHTFLNYGIPYTSLFLLLSHFYFPASGQAVVTSVVPSPPRFLPSIFIAHRVQQSNFLSIFHRVLLTRALAFSASQFVHKKKPPRIYTSMHSGGFEPTKLELIPP